MARAFTRLLVALGLVLGLAAPTSPSPSANEPPKEEDGVAVLNSANFDAFINSHRLVMVDFYAPW